jgi:hypothetical protein
LVVLVNTRVENASFGAAFPLQCQDGRGVAGCDATALATALRAEVNIEWPLRADELPTDQLMVFDMLEFLFEKAGRPVEREYHSYYSHHHLSFDIPAGQADFVEAVERVFARNGIAFEMTQGGLIRRLLPEHLAGFVRYSVFRTGDDEADRLLELARAAVTHPNCEARRDGLEKLWDAFERLKTLNPGVDKKARAEAMLARVQGGPKFRGFLDEEAAALTRAGNSLRIRHSEVFQEILSTSDQIDYLYFRMFTFVRLMVRANGWGS